MEILDQVRSSLPANAMVSKLYFEGSEVIAYTKNRDFFIGNEPVIKRIVNKLKKRIMVRPDPEISLDPVKAEKIIREAVPEDAGITNLWFEEGYGKVKIEAKKPGLVIGKSGSTLNRIKSRTYWLPEVVRTPLIPSRIVDSIRKTEYESRKFKRKFLKQIGEKIHQPGKELKWVRLTSLGGFREVGRSCILLQTPNSNVLLDCGLNMGSKEMFPYLEAPEFDLNKLDAVILSHSHLDHSGNIPLLFKYGYKGPVYCTAPTRDLSTLIQLDYINVAQREAEATYTSKEIEKMIKHTIPLEYGEVTDITSDIRLTLFDAGHIAGSSIVHLHIGEGLHNLIYSADWKVPIILIDKDENIEIKPIGKVVDALAKDSIKKGFLEEYPNIHGFKTIAFNPKTNQAEVVEITSFLRHPISEELFEIETRSGRMVAVTAPHSIFKVVNGNVVPSPARNLRVGDYILGIRKLPKLEKESAIDLIGFQGKIRIKITDDLLLEKVVDSFKDKFMEVRDEIILYSNLSIEECWKKVRSWIRDHYKGFYFYQIAKKHHVSPKTLRKLFDSLSIPRHPRVKGTIPSPLKISKDLARFLGYYIAEGSIHGNTVYISNKSKKILLDCARIIKEEFGMEGKIEDEGIRFCSKQLKSLLEVMKCGKDAYEKKVPHFLFNAKENVVSNFLYGYFSGDGWIRVRDEGRSISSGSVNEALIQDLCFLLLRYEIVPTIHFNKSSGEYVLSMYGKRSIFKFLNKIGIYRKKVKELKSSITQLGERATFDQRIPIKTLPGSIKKTLGKTSYQNAKSIGFHQLNRLLNGGFPLSSSCFFFDEIKEIKKIDSSSNYVYDLKINGYENFLGGYGFLFLHNTGDIKYAQSRLLNPANTRFPRVETLILESTYGDPGDIMPSRKSAESELVSTIEKTINRGGKVLIPVFSIGRSQEMCLVLEDWLSKEFRIPVYLDGMVWDATAIHTAYVEYLSRNLQNLIFRKGINPFLSEIFHRVGSPQEREEIINGGPCVVLATSGMMVGGPSVEYLKAFAENSKNMLIFVGYQAVGSLGRKIQTLPERKVKEIPIGYVGGKIESLEVNMGIKTIKGFSGHSDRMELIKFVQNLSSRPERIIVNHGEKSKCLSLAYALHKLYGIQTEAPKNLETIRLV